MHFLQAINSDLSVLIVCNKTGGTIKGDIKKIFQLTISSLQQYGATCTVQLIMGSNVLVFIVTRLGNIS